MAAVLRGVELPDMRRCFMQPIYPLVEAALYVDDRMGTFPVRAFAAINETA